MVREDDGPKVPHRQPTGQYINDVVLGYTQQDLARDQQPAITVDQVQRAQQARIIEIRQLTTKVHVLRQKGPCLGERG